MDTHTMATCDATLSILYIPEALRSTQEQRALEQHLHRCSTCRERSARLAGAIEAFRNAPDPPVPPTLSAAILDRVARDSTAVVHDPSTTETATTLEDTVAKTRPTSGTTFQRLMAWLLTPRVFIPVLVPACAAALLLVALPAGHQGSAVRDKSPGSASIRPSIDLQATVETVEPNGATRLNRAEDGMTLGPDDGLLFQFAIEGVTQISLVECDPMHEFHILFDHTVNDSTVQGIVPLTGPTGRLLRYTPDGPPGEYVYLAVASTEPFTWNAQLLDTVWNRYIDELLDPLSTGGTSTMTIDAIRLQFRLDADNPSKSAQPRGR